MTKCLIQSLLALVLYVGPAQAQLPPEDRTRRATQYLAVAFIAEAGWADKEHPEAEADHRAIFHVLHNRWPRMRKRFPRQFTRFTEVVRAYVAAMDPRTPKGGRVRWLLALTVEGADLSKPPPGWPPQASWPVHRVWWEEAVERAQGCMLGKRCSDPYRGRALHWGGSMDSPKGCMKKLPNVGTYNDFYSVDTTCVRARHRKRRS